MTPYTAFKYLYPPRTEINIKPGPGEVRSMWESFPDAIGQFKLNGTRNMFYIFPDSHIECWNRHEAQQKQYVLTPQMKQQIVMLGLPAGKFHVLDGELLQAKTRFVKDVAYMFDILVFNGEYLLGNNYLERYSLLSRLMNRKYFPLDFQPLPGQMYLAESFAPDRWEWMWKTAQSCDYCEGMVLKRTGTISKLVAGYRKVNNDSFMLRVRKPNPNYQT